jgi:hypothetical protein
LLVSPQEMDPVKSFFLNAIQAKSSVRRNDWVREWGSEGGSEGEGVLEWGSEAVAGARWCTAPVLTPSLKHSHLHSLTV